MAAILFAVLSSLCFGIALVTGRVGLRTLDARSGAAISVPTATVLFIVAAPFALDVSGFSIEAALLFRGSRIVFPGHRHDTHLSLERKTRAHRHERGSGTAPLFALLAAGLFLGERIPAGGGNGRGGCRRRDRYALVGCGCFAIATSRWALLWPLAGAVLRGIAQVAAKAGLLLWPNPFAAA
jgi:hypothetical protein